MRINKLWNHVLQEEVRCMDRLEYLFEERTKQNIRLLESMEQ